MLAAGPVLEQECLTATQLSSRTTVMKEKDVMRVPGPHFRSFEQTWSLFIDGLPIEMTWDWLLQIFKGKRKSQMFLFHRREGIIAIVDLDLFVLKS